jgi:hypothetical protein
VANIGLGDMEIRGGETRGDIQDVHQRIYNEDGSFSETLAGEFQFHPEHGHIHFEDFAAFRLREVGPDGEVGAVISTSDKVSFCLLDVEQYSGTASSNYHTCDSIQGISAGWADVYDSGLPGQAIDITGVLNGSYWLEIEVDPLNNLVEADETNNVFRVQIELDRDGAGGPDAGDLFEINDGFETASILAPPEDHLYEDLSIHAPDNDDFYKVTASADGTLSISLEFDNAAGDIDMRVFDSSQNQLAISNSIANREQVNIEALTGEQFFVQVYGYNGATNEDYSLLVDQPDDLPPPTGDAFESNDSFETASDLAPAEDTLYEDLSIHTPDNDDFYKVTASADGTLSISLEFDNAAGDIDMRVYDSSQNQLAISNSIANREQVNVEALTGEEFFVQVYGYNGATNEDYSLLVDQPDDLPPPTGGGSTITGTVSNDLIDGTDGDDVINGLAGRDVIFGSSGNDIVDGGGAEYDQVNYSESKNDYDFARNDDGTFSVTDSDGSIDLLSNIDGIWFHGSGEWFDIDDLA